MFRAPVPILRSFDEARIGALHRGFPGSEPVFEHRFEPAMPLYMGVTLGGCTLPLSEHRGDGLPCASMRSPADADAG